MTNFSGKDPRQSWVYHCAYKAGSIGAIQKRSKESGEVGLAGTATRAGQTHPAILWFAKDRAGSLGLTHGELYFPEIDKTYAEVKEEMDFRWIFFHKEAHAAAGQARQTATCVVSYLGTEYKVRADLAGDGVSSLEESVVMALAGRLAVSPYAVPHKEAIERGYVFSICEEDTPWAYEADLWCTLYCHLDDDRLSRAMDVFEMNGCDAKSQEALHRENMEWIYVAAKRFGDPKKLLDAFVGNPVITELILECYPSLTKGRPDELSPKPTGKAPGKGHRH